jgi:hypothetical protein
MFTTLNTALQVITNPTFSTNKQAQFLVGKILAATNVVSPVELSTLQAASNSVPLNTEQNTAVA